ncbi:hypothetical protein [Dietzia sp. UBA5065]|uniref:hypothetical protein n=1 Tax=Dietzia sp. UBA5065 TaxID=1946422 RepID=UPI0025C61F8F|nr:hypothetical protein [Dietzia sp. UBA5065]
MTPEHGRRAAVAATLAIAVAAGGCSSLGASGSPRETVLVTEVVTTVTAASPVQGGVGVPGAAAGVPPAPVPPAPDVPAALDAVISAVPGSSGVAVSAVGGAGEVRSAGLWRTGVAWSTIKVPLAVAVARTDPQALEASATAITVSDNGAAERLWDSLGGGASAASAVGAVLAEGGDSTSQVPSVHTRAGYTIFGQTRWALSDQARFGSRLPCLQSSARVLELMGQVSPDQRWGLGRIPGARVKGGWGPGEGGGYLVRQFGIVPGAGGDVAVALAIDAPSFEAGAAALSTMADDLAPHLPSIPGGVC